MTDFTKDINLDGLTNQELRKLLKECDAEIARLENEKKELKEEDRTDYAQHIMDKLFSTYDKGALWTDTIKNSALKEGYVYSPLGRIRRLYSAVMVNPKDKSLINRQVRRGSNAPIQGFASEIAVKASRLTLETYYKELPVLLEMLGIDSTSWEMQVECSRIVHDALYYAVPYEMVIPFLHITQYMVTYGIAQVVEEQFGIKFNIEPEVEFEISVNDGSDLDTKWDWSLDNLFKLIDSVVQEGVDMGIIDDPIDTKEKIFAPWKNKEVLKYLDKKYPLLNVHLAKKIYMKTKQYE